VLFDQILELPISERIRLVEDVWDTIAAVPDAAKIISEHQAELDRELKITG